MVGPHSTDEELKAADAEITASLKGHMTNFERAWLVADRGNIRHELGKRERAAEDALRRMEGLDAIAAPEGD